MYVHVQIHTAAALDTNTSQNISQTITTTVTSSAIRYPSHTNSNGKFTSVLNEQTELCSVTPLERWDRMDWYSSTSGNKIYVPFGYWLPDLWSFQPNALSMTPAESLYVDPQGRKLLEVTWEAVNNTRINTDKSAKANTGVYLGCCQDDFMKMVTISKFPGAICNDSKMYLR